MPSVRARLSATTEAYNLLWSAPELLLLYDSDAAPPRGTRAGDTWALAVIFVEIYTRRLPYATATARALNAQEIVSCVRDGRLRPALPERRQDIVEGNPKTSDESPGAISKVGLWQTSRLRRVAGCVAIYRGG